MIVGIDARAADDEPGGRGRYVRELLTQLTRIDADHRWKTDTLELLPIERREVDTPAVLQCQIFSPADSVTLVTLEDIG